MRLSEEMSEKWFKLPMALRVRWWNETEYGKKPPSEELQRAVDEAIKEGERHDERSQAATDIADGEGAADGDGEAHD